MKWESFFLTAITAGSAMAGAHHAHEHAHRRHRLAHNAELKAREVDAQANPAVSTKTIVNLEVVTMYTTITQLPPAHKPTTTVAAAEASTADRQTLASVNLDVAVNLLDVLSVSTSTATTFSTSTSSATVSAATSSSGNSVSWTSTPSNGVYSTSGFGQRTSSSGSGIEYVGNVGSPWGSNIIEVTASTASQYKYVVKFTGSNTSNWFVSFWNKIGPDGKMDGWYGHSALNFTLAAGQTRYVAFDENSQGGWGAAAGNSLPTDEYGGYACTWGEFDFGNTGNAKWSGWDVSAIQAQNAGLTVQGMRICNHKGADCSYITTNAAKVVNAYTAAEASVDGIGGSVSAGAVRLVVDVDYSG
ncbi:putative allergen Asp F4-like [Aspergillus novofumigatus IBT 16806]|uniref:Putative allergen Asp F4-like protein n=1 Tax=Aspergillus novofumigatus (strain IBT 16806) TaxID=1392255 RepID=A0A2I1BV42_ASPN1|nr:putative allergen Asp F4-like protein [Aspergillus novofumigatus IBT 16806]PKX89236.1 putative allergen Asp F4-like protein [Aspergillus novofumigatus IBT 16806]